MAESNAGDGRCRRIETAPDGWDQWDDIGGTDGTIMAALPSGDMGVVIGPGGHVAKFFDRLTPELITFIGKQHLFFVATACAEGRINLSPKGMDTFRDIDPATVAYLDLTGSGNETSAHLGHDGRITVMFCSFDKKPLILRLYGHGRVIRPTDTQWPDNLARFPHLSGIRQVIELGIESVQTSCGYAVPVFDLVEARPLLTQWSDKKGDAGLTTYRQTKNRFSIDGLATGLVD